MDQKAQYGTYGPYVAWRIVRLVVGHMVTWTCQKCLKHIYGDIETCRF